MNKILFGGDYNPEQWDEETWQEDMRFFKLAHVDTVTVNVFNWAMLQKDEETYDFSKLDQIIDLCVKNNLNIILATSTSAHPAWMARKHPDILRVDAYGIKRKFGGRHNSCPSSSTYRYYSKELARRIALRYKDVKNIIAWHISNEYGGECHCDLCQDQFRLWLKKKYQTIENVNIAWNTSFWSHTFYDFEDIVLPDFRSEEFMREEVSTNFQGISLDYRRFNSDNLLTCYREEYEVIKQITPHIPITTNFMGAYKHLDYQKWAPYLDFISWDNYPTYDALPYQSAFNHDLMRGLKQGQPFWLMEQTPSVSNWHPYCALKRPGVMRLWSYQALGHGSDTVLFFQMRRSIGACEKYHGALIDHAGHENTRVFREMEALGNELIDLKKSILNTRIHSKVAIIFDWDNWWVTGLSAGPSCLINYKEEVEAYYRFFYTNNIPVDLISDQDDFENYDLLIAPMLYMVKTGVDQKINDFVQHGGTFITTYFSGYVNENDLVQGAYPGKLSDVLGIWVEEIDALPKDKENHFIYHNKTYPCHIACDLLHLQGATSLSVYQDDFYQGMPVLTKNQYGKGTAYYIATRSNEDFYQEYLKTICNDLNIHPLLDVPQGVEVTKRENDVYEYYFILNHLEESVSISLKQAGYHLLKNQMLQNFELPSKDIAIIQYKK